MNNRDVLRSRELTQERLKKILHYDPLTGIFTNLVTRSATAVKGEAAGSLTAKGYLVIVIDCRSYKAHRLAVFYMEGRWPVPECDHRDGIRHNNAWANLRDATRSQNMQNRKANKNNVSGHRGVYVKSESKWGAYIRVGGKAHHLGYFNDAAEAAEAYKRAKAEMHPFQPAARIA